jgi:hypothetical protein
MATTRMLSLGQKWPSGTPDNVYWIAADPMASRVHHADGLIVMGRECSTLADLEA